MSDSTNLIPQVDQNATQREVLINELFADASPSILFSRNPVTTAALTWGYLGGRFGGTSFASGTVTLTGSTTNYVVANYATLVVSVSTATTNWNDASNYGRMYKIVTGSASVTSYEDHRAGARGILSGTGSGAMIVLSPSYAASLTVDLTSYVGYPIVIVNVGTLTGNITLNITNGTDGQIIRVRLKQDGTGSRTFAAGAALRFSTDTPSPTLSTGANKIDRLAFEWHGGDGKADLVATNLGYN